MKELELLWPVWDVNAPIMQPWSANEQVYKRFGLKGHNGIDIGVVTGTGVLASIDAVVRFAGDGFNFPIMGSAAGNCVVLETEELLIGYAHLSHIYVSEGASVALGDVLALSGATGAVTGQHLHWEALRKPLSLDNGYLGRFDITPYIKYPGTPIDTPPSLEEAPL
ncbi:M23 family metallopeptidase [Paenarthrobacter nicotinovorans]|uniref:M23 family metallopeptidase n=1 Tax=Paenarthrobacter nicotinovorans TaxID=29320 RepID=UPI003D6701EB